LLPEVQPWLATSKFATLWHLQSELSMPLDALRLSNASGAFDIDWSSIERGLLAKQD
jgi:type III secretion protein L